MTGAVAPARRASGAVAALVVLGCAGCGGGSASSQLRGMVGSEPFAAVVPRSFQMTFVWRTGRSLAVAPREVRLRVDSSRRPVLLLGDLFVPLRADAAVAPPPPFRFGNVPRVDDATWTEDGVLLVVSDRALGVATPEGFVPIVELPASGMRVVPAEPGRCWLFGGEGDFRRRLFLYDKMGTVAPFLAAPGPIAAVAGTAERVYVATGGALLRVTPGESAVLLYRGAEPIRAVAAAGDVGIFFTTAHGVFFLREGGASFRILDEGADDVHVRGDVLLLLFDGVGVVRGSPVSSFATLAGGRS